MAQDADLIRRYHLGQIGIHVWKDCVVQGGSIVRAARRFGIPTLVVYHRIRYPSSEYPGDV